MGKKNNKAMDFMRTTIKGKGMISDLADHASKSAIENGNASIKQLVAKPKKQRLKVKRKK